MHILCPEVDCTVTGSGGQEQSKEQKRVGSRIHGTPTSAERQMVRSDYETDPGSSKEIKRRPSGEADARVSLNQLKTVTVLSAEPCRG